MNINNIFAGNGLRFAATDGARFSSPVKNPAINSAFRQDSVSLGNTASPFQTYLSGAKFSSARADNLNLGNVTSRFHVNISNIQRPDVPTGYPVWPENVTLSLSDILAIELGTAPAPRGFLLLCWSSESSTPSGIRMKRIRQSFTDDEMEFLRYFQSRIEAVKQLCPSERDALIRDMDNLTKDEKFDAILAKYAGEPITETQFIEMLIKLEDLGAISSDSFSILIRAQGTGFTAEAFRLFYEMGGLPWTFEAECTCEYECTCECFIDLDELFLKELDRHDSELARQREIFGDSERERSNAGQNFDALGVKARLFGRLTL